MEAIKAENIALDKAVEERNRTINDLKSLIRGLEGEDSTSSANIESGQQNSSCEPSFNDSAFAIEVNEEEEIEEPTNSQPQLDHNIAHCFGSIVKEEIVEEFDEDQQSFMAANGTQPINIKCNKRTKTSGGVVKADLYINEEGDPTDPFPKLNGTRSLGDVLKTFTKTISKMRPPASSLILACPLCDRVFNDNGFLEDHIKRNHTVTDHQCKICFKYFNYAYTLQTHIIEVHEKIKPYPCTGCDLKFSRKSDLKRHTLAVHEGVKFVCDVCNKQVSRKNDLQRHKRIHTGFKPHVCDICTKPFGDRHDLNIHKRRMHKDVMFPNPAVLAAAAQATACASATVAAAIKASAAFPGSVPGTSTFPGMDTSLTGVVSRFQTANALGLTQVSQTKVSEPQVTPNLGRQITVSDCQPIQFDESQHSQHFTSDPIVSNPM